MADVRLRVVLIRRCPSGDDVPHIIQQLLHSEVLPIRIQHLPCRAVSVRHRRELYEGFVRLLHPRPLPTVGRVADVERIIVSESSCHAFCDLLAEGDF